MRCCVSLNRLQKLIGSPVSCSVCFSVRRLARCGNARRRRDIADMDAVRRPWTRVGPRPPRQRLRASNARAKCASGVLMKINSEHVMFCCTRQATEYSIYIPIARAQTPPHNTRYMCTRAISTEYCVRARRTRVKKINFRQTARAPSGRNPPPTCG